MGSDMSEWEGGRKRRLSELIGQIYDWTLNWRGWDCTVQGTIHTGVFFFKKKTG